MSRQAQLPPRCPLQKKNTAFTAIGGPVSPPSCKNIDLHPGVGDSKSMSQSSILEEQPAWLNDLLSDSEANFTGITHRRATSDSLTFLSGLVPLSCVDQLTDVENPDSCESVNGFESSCSYGPNSPRRKNKPGFPENEIASALSEYVMQNPVQHLAGHIAVSGVPQSDPFGNTCASADVINAEAKSMKRHPGQRSRVRKLQYIAELERTVDILQNRGSELAIRVASMLQLHVALSMENTTLKQQLLRMQQEKFIVDGEHQSLKEELERLKAALALAPKRKVQNWSRSAANLTRPNAFWEIPDMEKLRLN